MSDHRAAFALMTLAALGLAGCNNGGGNGGDEPLPIDTPPPATVGDSGGHGHDHPSEGPHHGDLVELGNEDYHAELVHGDDGSVTVYILDGSATEAVPIDAADVTINVTHDGRPEQFQLAASPDAGDPEGQSSRFVSDDAELAEHLDEEGAQARLVVVIDGQQFTGTVEHHHDHDHDHDHAHE